MISQSQSGATQCHTSVSTFGHYRYITTDTDSLLKLEWHMIQLDDENNEKSFRGNTKMI